MSVYQSREKWKITDLGQNNPLPFFRDFPPHLKIPTEDVDLEIGRHNGFKILPYKKQDQFSPELIEQEVNLIHLENDSLKASFLPDWGGRLISLFDKKKKQELIYNPQQIVLGNLAMREAWFAGGIEWNLGYYGHTVETCSPINSCIIENAVNGDLGLRLFSFNRMVDLWWQIDFVLNEDRLEAKVSVYNDTAVEKKLYWWTNIAVKTNQQRILTGNKQTVSRSSIELGFQNASFPHYHEHNIDYSYADSCPSSREFFFNKGTESHPWIASVDTQGNSFYEFSTQELAYRKIFYWGEHRGGQNWQNSLHRGSGSSYFELQAGAAKTQNHLSSLGAKRTLSWVHVFGSQELEPSAIHGVNWDEASQYYAKQLSAEMEKPLKMEDEYKVKETLTHAKSLEWGSLFIDKKDTILPPWLKKMSEKMILSPEIKSYSLLLDKEQWEDEKDEEQIEWVLHDRFEQAFTSIVEKGVPSWSVFLHLGVMERERFNFDKAIQFFLQSVEIKPNQFAYWGLCQIYGEYKDKKKAVSYGLHCLELSESVDSKIALAEFFLSMNLWEPLEVVINACSDEEQKHVRFYSILIPLAIYKKDYEKAHELILVFNPYRREGSFALEEYWAKIQEGKGTKEAIPQELDFTMFLDAFA